MKTKEPNHQDYRNEVILRDRIVRNQQEALFFLQSLRPTVIKMAYIFSQDFDADITCDELFGVCYLALFEHDCQRLRAFKGQSKLATYAISVCHHEIIEYLRKERGINIPVKVSTSQYRLKLRSVKDESVRKAVVDLVHVRNYHAILSAYYVSKLSDEEIIEQFGGEEQAKALLKAAQDALISLLLKTENRFRFVLVPRRKIPVFFRSLDALQYPDIADEVDDEDDVLVRLMSEVYKKPTFEANFICFVNEAVKASKWKEEKKENSIKLFIMRTIYRIPARKVGEEFEISESTVNQRYKEILGEIRKYANHWIAMHQNGKGNDNLPAVC